MYPFGAQLAGGLTTPAKKSAKRTARNRQNHRVARPKLLTPTLIERMTDAVATGGRPESVGVSIRSVERWRARGRADLAALSLEARLELGLRREEAKVRALGWQALAARLDAGFGSDWTPGDFEPD